LPVPPVNTIVVNLRIEPLPVADARR
jgi:hypothetical protein